MTMKRLEKTLCAALEALLAGKKTRLPDTGHEILDAFLALSRARTYHANGPNSVTWEAMAAYAGLMRRPIPPHQVQIIMALDDVWMRHASRQMGKEGTPTMGEIADKPMTPQLFDALFG